MIAADICKRLFLLCLLAAPALARAEATILVFGDSLSAGYGIAVQQSWPSLLGKRIADHRLGYAVANASVSGETTAGGRTRLPAALQRFQPNVVILALGANDGLRGLPLAQMRDNLTAMIDAAKARRAQVLLVGMRLPPTYGPDYDRRFEQSFQSVAKREKVPLLPFLLAPIATDPDAFQADGLHPTAAAQGKILDHLWPALQPLLK
jgi:acyl-CoA thioesterase I